MNKTRREVLLVIGGGVATISCGVQPTKDSDGSQNQDSDGPSTTETTESTDTNCVVTPQDSWTALSSTDSATLATLGSSMEINAGGQSLIVAHVEQDCYVALDRRCSHEGCSIYYQYEYRRFACPCHAAVYDEDGNKVVGPQPTGVEAFQCGMGQDGIIRVKT